MLQKQYLIRIKRSSLVFIKSGLKKKVILTYTKHALFILGRNISSNWAISKLKSSEKLEKSLAENQEVDKEGLSQDTQKENDSSNTQKKITKEKNNLRKQKIRKLHKIRKQKKRARIVIRNLAFQVFVMYCMYYEKYFFFNTFLNS